MNLATQRRRTRRSHWLVPAAFVLLAVVWGAGAARADIYVHVLMCIDQPFEAEAFDAKDGVRIYPADTKQFRTKGQSEKMHCAGQGEGYCQMILTVGETQGSGGKIGFHLDSGKWAKVTAYNYNTEEFTVERNLDSAPTCN